MHPFGLSQPTNLSSAAVPLSLALASGWEQHFLLFILGLGDCSLLILAFPIIEPSVLHQGVSMCLGCEAFPSLLGTELRVLGAPVKLLFSNTLLLTLHQKSVPL